jgi:putative toxin-antitoxin system antitoxin component (TIGR02293 family)
MTATVHSQAPEPEARVLARAYNLIGGKTVVRHAMRNRLDAHDVVAEGLPGSALVHLFDKLIVMTWSRPMEDAIGLSQRTYQRSKETPSKRLSVEQSGKTWKFAETLSLATEVMGSQKEAELWFERPALGLDGRRPIDLMKTPAGTELVETFLQQINYGVYV